MRAQFTASRSFGASIRPAPDSGSNRLIVKAFRIKATVAGEAMTSWHNIDDALEALVLELEGRVLEDMMPGAATTLLGIATWSMERLAGVLPKLTRVEVLELWPGLGREGGAVMLERNPSTGV